jgi:mannitol-1-phosphate 5-dehydrogenase
MQERVFVGFGFGAIQSGLFLFEAFQSRNFNRLVVAEVMPDVVATVRAAGGTYRLNVATPTGIEAHEIAGIEIFNPTVPADRAQLVEAIAQASELATALPSVEFFDRGTDSVARLLAEGLSRARQRAVLYAGENHNHAAEILAAAVRRHAGKELPEVQFLNTVIGKMSKVVTEAGEIATQRLAPVTPGASRAFLVEEFNRILISKVAWPDFPRGITVFAEKPDLLPFEEAKLYGHNAVHALLGYLAHQRGLKFMSECAGDAALMTLAREAFLEESGPALIHRRGGVDALFTTDGYRAYAEDLLVRMVNPYLRDAVERVIRDPQRKLAWEDRLVGTMRLALDAGVTPSRFAQGAKAALTLLPGTTLAELWAPAKDEPPGRKAALQRLIG